MSSKYNEFINNNIYKEYNIYNGYDIGFINNGIKSKDIDFSYAANFSDLFKRRSKVIGVRDLIMSLKDKKVVDLAGLNYTIGNRKVQIADDTELSIVNDYIKKLRVPQGGFSNPVTKAVLTKFILPNGMNLYDKMAKLYDTKNTKGQANNKQVVAPSNQNNPNVQLNGRQVDAGKMWSPKSFSGVVYEFNRGVYGISANKFYRKNLDHEFLHHAGQTNSIILEDTGIDNKFINPFEAAVSAVGYGIVIVQLEGSECFIYLPSSINNYQKKELENILRPRNGFHFLVYKDGLTYDDKDNGEDLNLDDVFALVGTALENTDALSNKLA